MNSPQGSSPGTDRTDFPPDPENQQNDSRKRKRKTFSCDQCRKRKLRCDRTYPACTRCQKSGNAAGCVYETMPEPASNTATPSRGRPISEVTISRPPNMSISYVSPPLRPQYYPPNPQTKRIADLEDRIAQIDPSITSGEHQIKRRALGLGSTPSTTIGSSETAFNISLYGKGFKTGFFGTSSERGGVAYTPSLLKLFPEFKVYLLDSNLQSPAFSQLRSDAMKIRKNAKIAKKFAKKCLLYPSVVTLVDAVPEKDKVTHAVEIYWNFIESSYRILHAPTFWSNYWKYWANPMEREESFAATMLLMISIVNCLDQPRPRKYRALSSVGREQAIYWIEACEDWINRQSRKHLTIESFQHKILLCIAKQINCIKIKQVWERAQGLLSFAVATGLHQDPVRLDETHLRDHPGVIPQKSRTTCFEREMRRRLWATIVELELQASIDKGVPSSRFVLLADCGRPSLIADEQFDELSTTLPAPEARETYTPVAYLHCSHDSLRLRASILEVVNTGHASYEDILEYDDQVNQALSNLPEWARLRNDDANLTPSPSAALLEIQLRQFQILLHLPFARRTENNSRYNLSRMTCIDAGDRILQLHIRLASSGNFALNLLREDAFRATMAICYNAIMWRGVKNDLSIQGMGELYTSRAESGVSLLEEKVLCLGEYYAQIWYISSAFGMLKSAFFPQALNTHVASVAERLTSLFAKVVAAQEEPSNEQTAAGALTALATPNSSGYDGTAASGMNLSDVGATQAFIDGVDMSAWGFDELWPFTSTGVSW